MDATDVVTAASAMARAAQGKRIILCSEDQHEQHVAASAALGSGCSMRSMRGEATLAQVLQRGITSTGCRGGGLDTSRAQMEHGA